MLYIHFAILSHLYYVYPLFFGFPSHLCHHQVLRRIVCAISKFSYLFYTQCIYVSLNLPIHLTCVCVCVCVCARACALVFSRRHGLQPTRLLCPWNFPGKSTDVAWHLLLQGIIQPRYQTYPGSPALAGRFLTTSATWEAPRNVFCTSVTLQINSTIFLDSTYKWYYTIFVFLPLVSK